MFDLGYESYFNIYNTDEGGKLLLLYIYTP